MMIHKMPTPNVKTGGAEYSAHEKEFAKLTLIILGIPDGTTDQPQNV